MQGANVQYSAHIVSNGYLLTPELARELVELKVDGAQITIDGTKDIHDARRPLHGGKPTFDVILENVNRCADIIPISIRVNIDKNNVQQNDRLLNQLVEKRLQDRISVYLGWVEPSNGCYSATTCLTLSEFSEEKLRFAAMLTAAGFKYSPMSDYPNLRYRFCGADAFSSDVIAPNGDIYAAGAISVLSNLGWGR